MKRSVVTSLMLVSILAECILILASPPIEVEEYTLKAVFLERFTRFIEWPEESQISDTEKPFVLGVIGNKSFADLLASIYQKKKIRNKKVSITLLDNPREAAGCHLLFIAESENKHLREILATTRDKPILTVGDGEGFARQGILINFFIRDGRLCFEINESAAADTKLKISHLLLEAAKIVYKKLPAADHV